MKKREFEREKECQMEGERALCQWRRRRERSEGKGGVGCVNDPRKSLTLPQN